ncbi:MAG TPA: Stk1 family PASTA domain-containing Ser/Thr kinase [Solirubrobacteraceae bacterium]|jgi:serine/threonine-protein kinase
MIEPGSVIDDRYEVLQRVGSGGMADVYLAEDRLLGRRVAVKVLHHRFAEDQEFVERFKREASSAAGLSHPNVVSVFDRGAWDGTFYIAMEYLPGRTLKELLRAGGPLTPASAIDVVLQVLRAARFAHRRGVIHRDLKPHNVILDEEGRAKVTDFGIARAGASDMTLTGSIMGTAQYLSPEQAQGHAVTEASDLYAVGVMLYELLVGKVPFEGETAITIALQHISRPAPPPSAINPAVPPALDAVVLRMLAKDPAARYASTGDAIAALEAVRANLPEPQGEHVLATAPRDVALAGGAAAATLAGAAAASAANGGNGAHTEDTGAGRLAAYGAEHQTTGSVPVLDAAAEQQAKRAKRRRALLWVGGLLAAAVLAAILLLILLPTSVTVPNVEGKPRLQAVATLKRDGFKVSVSSGTNPSVPAGDVVSQTPRPGRSVKPKSLVYIVVSAGVGSAVVPKLTGETEAAAISSLDARGLRPHVKEIPSETFAAGRVIRTEPPAGERLEPKARVIVFVSSGLPKVKVPHLKEESIEQAEAELEEAGLGLGKVKYQPRAGVAAGTVLSQDPAAGDEVRAESLVNLVVAKATHSGSGKVFVPSVLEEERAAAEETLRREGLKPSVLPTPVSEASLAGHVVRQDPAPGTEVAKKSTVTIYIGHLQQTTSTSTSTTSTTSSETSTTSTTTSTSTSTTAPPEG